MTEATYRDLAQLARIEASHATEAADFDHLEALANRLDTAAADAWAADVARLCDAAADCPDPLADADGCPFEGRDAADEEWAERVGWR